MECKKLMAGVHLPLVHAAAAFFVFVILCPVMQVAKFFVKGMSIDSQTCNDIFILTCTQNNVSKTKWFVEKNVYDFILS